MAFTFIPNADLLPGKPLSTDLMTQLRDNDDFLKAALDALAFLPREAVDATTRSTGSGTPVLIAGTKLTYTAAELTVNRKALVLLTGVFALSTTVAGRVAIFSIRVDGVDQAEFVDFDASVHAAANVDHGFSIIALVDLVSGANRDIDATFSISPAGTVTVTQTQIQTILVG